MPEHGLVLAPLGREAPFAQTLLAEAGIDSEIVSSLAELVVRLNGKIGFAVVAEEALHNADTAPVRRWRHAQPEWSDLPFIILTDRGALDRDPAAARYFDVFGNVTFVERPFHATTLAALAKSALRGRHRQYEARARLEALHHGEERFRAAIDAMQGVLWTNSTDGRMAGEQPAWAALSGQTFEEYQDFGWSKAIHPDDAQATVDAWNRAVAHKTPFAFEHRLRRHDGVWRDYSVRAIPTFTTDGALRQWVGVHTDITERRAAEVALRELNLTLEDRVAAAIAERKVFADIFETTDSLVQVADTEFRWLAINRAASDELLRMVGRRPHVGDSIVDFLADAPDLQAAARTLWQRALDGEEFTETARFGASPHEGRSYEMKFNTLRDAAANRIGAFQVMTDVTERLADADRLFDTQEALRQSQKMEAIGQLTGGVAHDFNNLLTIIRGGAEMLRRSDIASPRRQQVVEAIFDASERAAKLTQQLLAFSRRQPLRPQVFDVGQRVDATMAMLRSLVGSRIDVVVDSQAGLRVYADPAQLETSLVNLCINAKDAMHGEGRLTIRTFAQDDQVCVAVEDDGDGVDPAILSRLFDPFFTTKAVGKGTGLGLSQVYGFARQSGGDVKVVSTPGAGACFTLYLPKTDDPVTADLAADAVAPRPSQRILVVEDNADLRSFAAALLAELGHAVESAGSGDEALARLGAEPDRFDVVFTDVVMAGMSGLQLARRIRDNWPRIRVVLTSGYSDALANAEGLEFPLISKPYSSATLASIL